MFVIDVHGSPTCQHIGSEYFATGPRTVTATATLTGCTWSSGSIECNDTWGNWTLGSCSGIGTSTLSRSHSITWNGNWGATVTMRLNAKCRHNVTYTK